MTCRDWLRDIVATGDAETDDWCGWCSGPIDRGDWCGRDDHDRHVCAGCMNVQSVTVTIPKALILNANDRGHWGPKSSKTAALRVLGTIAARELKPMRAAQLTLTWQFPDRRRRDSANLGDTAKAAIDGMVEAGVLPDDDWRHLDGPDPRYNPELSPPGLVTAVFTFTERDVL